ncbi:MAG TPA: hypothetical protein ENF47_03000 [Thermoprotei archaeon]|nr:hypothetical protein [Thermoprotei archaeon]
MEFIPAKEFRELDIDGVISSIDIAINVLRDKYARLKLTYGDKDWMRDYDKRITYLAYQLLDIICKHPIFNR